MGKTTKTEVEKSQKEAREAYAYHLSLEYPEKVSWEVVKNSAKNLKHLQAKFYMLLEAYNLGM